MTGCQAPGATVWLSYHDNPQRKLPWTWELVQIEGDFVCIHSARANQVVEEALASGLLSTLARDRANVRREVALGDASRADFFIEEGRGLYLEVKAVTLHLGRGHGAFPDAVSQRATKHLVELQHAIVQGYRAALVFCVLHGGITDVSPAASIDPVYAAELSQAMRAGLEVYSLFNDISTDGIYPREAYQWEIPN
jgi:sugar fermentation stimulation protein A